MIRKETKHVRYLLGQLKALHDDRSPIQVFELSAKYDGTSIFDENDKVTPIQLVALGIATASTSKLSDNNYISFITSKKTLSPYDPAYPAWWAEHKAEWEG